MLYHGCGTIVVAGLSIRTKGRFVNEDPRFLVGELVGVKGLGGGGGFFTSHPDVKRFRKLNTAQLVRMTYCFFGLGSPPNLVSPSWVWTRRIARKGRGGGGGGRGSHKI